MRGNRNDEKKKRRKIDQCIHHNTCPAFSLSDYNTLYIHME